MKHLLLIILFSGFIGQLYAQDVFDMERTEWEGYARYDFMFKERDVIMVTPYDALPGNPWIWRPAFFGAFPSVDIALLKEGFHVVYYDLTHLYGAPLAISLGNDFYQLMVDKYELSPKVTLEGFSRGGLFAFNWTAAYPDKVACIYVDAPVCDMTVWPGTQDEKLWNDMLELWEKKPDDIKEMKGNPVNNMDAIIKARIPVIAVCGDADEPVPYDKNMGVIHKILKEADSPVEVILKPGVGHHPHSLEDPTPVVKFIMQHQ